MRKILTLGSVWLAGVVVLGAGCFGSSTSSTKTSPTSTKDAGGKVMADTTKSYAVGDEASAGDIVHQVVSVEAMDTIPASATLPEWELIAADMPAADGFQWLYIVGEVTNNSKETQSITSTNVYVRDAEANQFSVATDTTIYVDSDKSPVYISVQPTQTVTWEGYFEVPQDAAGLVLVGDDLSFLPESEVEIDLGL